MIYVLQMQGGGDDELAFANIGVYDNVASLNKTKRKMQADEPTIVFNVEVFELND